MVAVKITAFWDVMPDISQEPPLSIIIVGCSISTYTKRTWYHISVIFMPVSTNMLITLSVIYSANQVTSQSHMGYYDFTHTAIGAYKYLLLA
jgi:predicted permease